MMRGRLPWALAAAVWAGVIVVFGVIPTHETLQSTVGVWEDLVASLGHFLEYAVLAFLLAAAVDGWRLSVRALVWAAVLSVALGWAIELVQAPLPYRDFQVADGLVDMAGVVVGLAAFSAVAWWRAARPREHRG